MFTFVILLMVAAVFCGAFFIVSGRNFTSPAGKNHGTRGDSDDYQVIDDQDLPFYGTKGSHAQVVMLPNGQLGYRNGLDLNGNHF